MDGRELRRWRLAMDLSQEQLAPLLGITQNAISRWESGKVAIRHARILALALRGLEQERALASIEPVGDGWMACPMCHGEGGWNG